MLFFKDLFKEVLELGELSFVINFLKDLIDFLLLGIDFPYRMFQNGSKLLLNKFKRNGGGSL